MAADSSGFCRFFSKPLLAHPWPGILQDPSRLSLRSCSCGSSSLSTLRTPSHPPSPFQDKDPSQCGRIHGILRMRVKDFSPFSPPPRSRGTLKVSAATHVDHARNQRFILLHDDALDAKDELHQDRLKPGAIIEGRFRIPQDTLISPPLPCSRSVKDLARLIQPFHPMRIDETTCDPIRSREESLKDINGFVPPGDEARGVTFTTVAVFLPLWENLPMGNHPAPDPDWRTGVEGRTIPRFRLVNSNWKSLVNWCLSSHQFINVMNRNESSFSSAWD